MLDVSSGASHPSRIGSYRILRLLGKGGMGAVFEAEQENPRRVVALKVVTAGVLTEDMLRRFELEAQVLGYLHHPCIAQIYEAGMYESDGGVQPYFAMELIDGSPLHRFVQDGNLSAHDRLELIARICDGIQHAHQRGVIHRDLKPDNILVDKDGQPKILDFGLARATDADLQAATLHTDIGQIMGTIPYMSPEQASGDPRALDSRTDIYSLGVVAYRILSGEMPYSVAGEQALEALRIVREEEAKPLSSINRALRGDIETILGKALQKDPARRYESASDLAADIRRHLNDEPIDARPPSTFYQLGKFARRNKALMTGVAAVFVALTVGLFGTLKGYVAANNEALRANKTANFFEAILLAVDPVVAQGMDTTLLKRVLDDTEERIDEELTGFPFIEADIRDALTTAYFAIAAYEEAGEHAQRSYELFCEVRGERHHDALNAQRKIAMVATSTGFYDRAEELLLTNLDAWTETLGPESEEAYDTRAELGILYLSMEEADRAAAQFEDVLRFRRSQLGSESDDTMIAINCLGLARIDQGRHAEAEGLLREALDLRTRFSGPTHPDTIKAVHNLAGAFSTQGRYDEAEALYREAIDRYRDVVDEDDEAMLDGKRNLALLLRSTGRNEEAREIYESILQACYKRYGRETAYTYELEFSLAETYRELRDPTRGLPFARHAYEGKLALYGEANWSTLLALNSLLWHLEQLGDPQADEIQARLPELFLETLGPDHRDTLIALNDAAIYHRGQGRFQEAEQLALQSLEGKRRVLGNGDSETKKSLWTLACIYWEQRLAAPAVPYLAEFIPAWAEDFGDDDSIVQRALGDLMEALPLVEDLSPFEAELANLVDYLSTRLAPEAPNRLLISVFWADALAGLGRAQESSEIIEGAFELFLEGPPPARAFSAYGAALTQLGRLDEAEEALLLAWEEGGSEGLQRSIAARMASLHEARGAQKEARTWRARADR